VKVAVTKRLQSVADELAHHSGGVGA
jgi:hypothetical protein